MIVSNYWSFVEQAPEPIAEYPHADEVGAGEQKTAGTHLRQEPSVCYIENMSDADACQRGKNLGVLVDPVMDGRRRHGAPEGRRNRHVEAPATPKAQRDHAVRDA